MVMSWHENLADDEIPPKHLWSDSEGLDEWFERVKERREAKYGGKTVQDDDGEENEYARELKKVMS